MKIVTVMIVFVSSSLSLAGAAVAWWDDFPGIIQTGDATKAAMSQANASLCGGADDPCWGLYAQRVCLNTFGQTIADHHKAGLKSLSWFEGFGTCESYIAQLKRDSTGAWMLQSSNSPLTRIYSQHWSWQDFDETGEIRWVGLPNYFDNDDFARPWTRTHPRYGAPPMRYPDGQIATGCNGSPTDPRNSRVLDAGCSKDVLGRVTFEYDYNETVNRLEPGSRRPHGPTNGLIRVDGLPSGPPDPGFTPKEWNRIKKAGYAGVVSAGKDSACPIWIDYLHASVQAALDAGVDGLWVDNYSPWDSFNANPVVKAFGDWSVAGFRGHLSSHFSGETLKKMGVTNTANFDIRLFLREQCKEWHGDPENLADPEWRDARWLDNPVWRAFLIYKRQTGAEALTRYYRMIKETAAAAGKPDFLVMGNDIPLFSLGWVRGDLDMVSTELTWGWHLTSGPRGILPPPIGNYTPVYKLAREHARGRFVNAWMYGPNEQLGRTNIARVLYYQALANQAMPMPNPGGRTVGNTAVNSEFFAFLRRIAPIFQDRQPVEEVGVYYSSSSQLMEMTPGGFRDHNHQPHSFAFWGWGTALSQLHIPWRAIPQWKLNTETLRNLRLLIIPESKVFDPGDLLAVKNWVMNGGALVVTGNSGSFLDERDNFDPASENTLIAFAKSHQPESQNSHAIGKGRVFWLRDDPGIPYYEATDKRTAMIAHFANIFSNVGMGGNTLAISASNVPPTVGITLYKTNDRVFADVNNTDIQLITDTLIPAQPLHFSISLPPELRTKKLAVRVISPGDVPRAELGPVQEGRVEVKLESVAVYASVIIEQAKN